jgi:hypothetical protein
MDGTCRPRVRVETVNAHKLLVLNLLGREHLGDRNLYGRPHLTKLPIECEQGWKCSWCNTHTSEIRYG